MASETPSSAAEALHQMAGRGIQLNQGINKKVESTCAYCGHSVTLHIITPLKDGGHVAHCEDDRCRTDSRPGHGLLKTCLVVLPTRRT